MDSQLKAWKLRADRFWFAASPDYREAAQLAADIAGSRADDALRQAAAQALPSLRNAVLKGADRSTRELARRRLSVVRDLLHILSATPFGKRGQTPEPLTPQERDRQMLGLPFGRRLSVPRDPAGLQARRQEKPPGRWRQRAGFCPPVRRPRRADQGEVSEIHGAGDARDVFRIQLSNSSSSARRHVRHRARVRATRWRTMTNVGILAARCARVLQIRSPPKKKRAQCDPKRDAGKTGCALHPRSRVQG
jgi:hypothetical protein